MTTGTKHSDEVTEESRFGSVVSPADVREAVEAVARQVPEVARGSRAIVEETMNEIEASSDERVAAGVTMSLGLAVGMLIGGAPRILVALALLPVAAFGIVLMDRRGVGRAMPRGRAGA